MRLAGQALANTEVDRCLDDVTICDGWRPSARATTTQRKNAPHLTNISATRRQRCIILKPLDDIPFYAPLFILLDCTSFSAPSPLRTPDGNLTGLKPLIQRRRKSARSAASKALGFRRRDKSDAGSQEPIDTYPSDPLSHMFWLCNSGHNLGKFSQIHLGDHEERYEGKIKPRKRCGAFLLTRREFCRCRTLNIGSLLFL